MSNKFDIPWFRFQINRNVKRRECFEKTVSLDFQIYLKEEIVIMSNKFDIPKFRFQENRKVKRRECFEKTVSLDFQIYLKEETENYVK